MLFTALKNKKSLKVILKENQCFKPFAIELYKQPKKLTEKERLRSIISCIGVVVVNKTDDEVHF